MPGPNFLIIGAQKSGTTWVSHRLQQHPQVFMVHGTYFFDNPANYAKGVQWYHRFFENAGNAVAVGEKTPSYLWGEKFRTNGDPENVPKRVQEVMPDAKLIVVLRNPVNRAVSHFNHAIRAGLLSPFTNMDRALTGSDEAATRGEGLLERGLYCRQIERWLRYFPAERCKILVFERDVVEYPLKCLTGLCNYLGIDHGFQFTTVHSKENQKLSKAELILKYYAPAIRKPLKPLLRFFPLSSFTPSPSTYAFLADYYAEENARLAKFLGIDLSCWKRAVAA
jgi:hypothetical protein